MRRKDRAVNDLNEIVEVISNCDVCRIALNDQDYPYIVPLNFGFEVMNEKVYLYFHSALEGHKIDLIKNDGRASFEMDCKHELQYFAERGYCTMSYESVTGRGNIRFLEDSEKPKALSLIMEHYHMKKGVYYNPAAIPRTAVYCLEVEQIIGKRKVPK